MVDDLVMILEPLVAVVVVVDPDLIALNYYYYYLIDFVAADLELGIDY